jgi:nicotinamidase-related amidase
MDALMVIDVQQAMFADPDNLPYEGEAMVARIRSLIERARAAGKPVFFIQHDGGPGDTLDRAGPGFAYRPELAPRAGDPVIVKRYCSGFQETDLQARLQAAAVKDLAICGMQTEYCVDTTLRAAFERGYRVTLVADGHSTFDNESLSARDIIRHHNRTLHGSFATLVQAEALSFA